MRSSRTRISIAPPLTAFVRTGACICFMMLALGDCSDAPTKPAQAVHTPLPSASVIFPADTPGTEVFRATLPLADTTTLLNGFPLNTFSEPLLVQLSASGMIHAHNIPGDPLDKDFGPSGWYSGSTTTAGIRIFFNYATALSPASPGDHTTDPVNSKLTVVTGAGSLNRGPGFACTATMPKNCWQYTSAGQSVVVKLLAVPIVLQAEVGGAALTSHVVATQVTFKWYMPDWAQNASGPAGGTPYKTRRWTWYPDGGIPVVLPFATTDSIFKYRQYQVTQSGRMEVEVRINGQIDTSSALVVIRCHVGDALLDNQMLADSLEAAWDHTHRDSLPSRRLEQGLTFGKDLSGHQIVKTDFDNPANTPCTSVHRPWDPVNDSVIAHTHPFAKYEALPDNCGPGYHGDTATWGPSKQDMEFLPPNARGVIIDPRYAWVYDKKKSYYKKKSGAGCTYP
jgi:hypothetical protein